MEPSGGIGAFIKAAGAAFWRLTHVSRMQDRHRLEILSRMKDKLHDIGPMQSRPDNHICIKYCYKHRALLNDIESREQIESANELITRNRFFTFENVNIIENIILNIDKEILNIKTK
jgi:hypothetical protein